MEAKGAITFIEYKVKKVFFEINEKFEDESVSIEFIPSSNVLVDRLANIMTVDLEVKVFPDPYKKNYPFSMDIVIEGVFRVLDEEEDDILKYKTNAIAILFPYIRSIITTYTAAANVAPLILPTINVNKMLENVDSK